ncbi:MAG: hypothetical protein LBP98_04145 [Tannerella sp.]|jgi:hypothetical protein|nr:hypothetical protein [Tannerella sp.]
MKIKDKTGHRNLIRFDWALKHLLRNKADFNVLEGFLTVLQEENMTIRNIDSNPLKRKAGRLPNGGVF